MIYDSRVKTSPPINALPLQLFLLYPCPFVYISRTVPYVRESLGLHISHAYTRHFLPPALLAVGIMSSQYYYVQV